MRPFSLATLVLLLLIALAHALRLALQVEIGAAGRRVPMWASALGVLLPGALAWGLARERHLRP